MNVFYYCIILFDLRKALLQMGADVNYMIEGDARAVHIAVQSGNLSLFDLLLNPSVFGTGILVNVPTDLNATLDQGQTLLMLAAEVVNQDGENMQDQSSQSQDNLKVSILQRLMNIDDYFTKEQANKKQSQVCYSNLSVFCAVFNGLGDNAA